MLPVPNRAAFAGATKRRIGARTQTELEAFLTDWPFWARAAQRPPPGDWRCWLFMGGRGAGKTRAGAEWVRSAVSAGGCGKVALVAPTLLDAREVMIEGTSGLRAVGPLAERPAYVASRRRLEWPNGAVAQVYSAEDPDSLRGPQFDAAWCDEIGVWAHGEAVWDMLMLGLRLGDRPRAAATTTPKATALVKRLLAAADTAVTRAATAENAENLAPGFLTQMQALYGGARMGRQELDGELLEDVEGALWMRSGIEAGRLRGAPEDVTRVVVAVDPPATVGDAADACGIVAAGLVRDGRCAVLADASAGGLAPLDWAGRAAALAAKLGAAEIVAEANQGGEMVREVLAMAGAPCPVRLVHARFSKAMRAAPVAALYAQGKVLHAGAFPALEDEMCVFGSDAAGGSPDRMDALVWAVSVLMLGARGGAPRVRRV